MARNNQGKTTFVKVTVLFEIPSLRQGKRIMRFAREQYKKKPQIRIQKDGSEAVFPFNMLTFDEVMEYLILTMPITESIPLSISALGEEIDDVEADELLDKMYGSPALDLPIPAPSSAVN